MSFEPCWSSYFCYFPTLLPNMTSDEDDVTQHFMAKQNPPSCRSSTFSNSCCSSFSSIDEFFASSTILLGNAFDLILTNSSQNASLVACSDVFYCFDKSSKTGMKVTTPQAQIVVLEVDTVSGKSLRFPVKHQKIRMPEDIQYPMEERRVKLVSNGGTEDDDHSLLALATIASSVKSGRNRARYLLLHEGDVVAIAPINIFLWSEHDRIIVVDIDGTITKSNVRGVLDTILTTQYQHCHPGVCKFFSSLLLVKRQFNQQTRLVYLSSRPITLANTTKKFLSELRQHEEMQLPHGPLIGYPGTLTQVLLMELVTHSVNEFKAKALREQVVRPFSTIGVSTPVLLAGFGNTQMDAQAYHKAGCEMIFLIDKQSKICSLERESASSVHSRPHRHSTTCRLESTRIRGLLFEGYSDNNLMEHISRSPTAAISSKSNGIDHF